MTITLMEDFNMYAANMKKDNGEKTVYIDEFKIFDQRHIDILKQHKNTVMAFSKFVTGLKKTYQKKYGSSINTMMNTFGISKEQTDDIKKKDDYIKAEQAFSEYIAELCGFRVAFKVIIPSNSDTGHVILQG